MRYNAGETPHQESPRQELTHQDMPAQARSILRLLGFLNLRGISGQIAALVVASFIAIHLIITATFFLLRPDQPNPSGGGHSQLIASIQLLGAAPAAQRPRLIADIARALRQGRSPRRQAIPMSPACGVCTAGLAATIGCSLLPLGRTPTGSA